MISSSPARMLWTANSPRGEEGVAPLTTMASEMRAPCPAAQLERRLGLAVREPIAHVITSMAAVTAMRAAVSKTATARRVGKDWMFA